MDRRLAAAFAGLPALALAPSTAAAPTTTVTVVATAHRCTLSRTSVPAGAVVFRLVDRGRTRRTTFTIAGKRTSTTLRISLPSPGFYPYRCGATAGRVVVDAPPATTDYPGPGGTVTVSAYEFGFAFSTTTIPSGNVTFVVRNIGTVAHDFDIVSVQASPYLEPGQTFTETVNLEAGRTYTYVCDVRDHFAEGMEGTFTPVG